MTRTAIALAALLAASPAQAQNYLDLTEVDRAVVLFTGSPQGTTGGAAQPADRRLRLMPCPADLALSWYGARRDAVEVRCPVAGGWKLYVPIVGGGAGPTAAAPVILRGDAVTISVRSDGFAVSQPGEALEAGAIGAWIKVRGASSASGAASGQGAPVLRAKVLRPGLVGMDLP